MLVRDIDVVESPLAPGRARLRGEVVCDDPSIPPEVYWFDIPTTHAGALGATGNPWTVLLAPLAVHLGEPLRVPKPVDRDLLANIHEVMRIWHCWFPDLQPVPVVADELVAEPESDIGLTASMFSGGVDAWFTLLSNNGSARHPGWRQIDEVLCIWGLDVSLEQPGEFRRMRDTLAQSTAGLAAFVDVATNLHETQWWKRADWGHVAHGCGLASIALAFGNRYSRVLIPSSHRYDDPSPWGSHPLTDPLLSTRRTRLIHDGSGYSRVDKTAAIAESNEALQSLQVCWETKSFKNCGACVKCYRTMATLHLLGALGRDGHRSDDRIVAVGLQARDDTGPLRRDDLRRPTQSPAHLTRRIHVKPLDLALVAIEAERWVAPRQRHAKGLTLGRGCLLRGG